MASQWVPITIEESPGKYDTVVSVSEYNMEDDRERIVEFRLRSSRLFPNRTRGVRIAIQLTGFDLDPEQRSGVKFRGHVSRFSTIYTKAEIRGTFSWITRAGTAEIKLTV